MSKDVDKAKRVRLEVVLRNPAPRHRRQPSRGQRLDEHEDHEEQEGAQRGHAGHGMLLN